MANILFYENQFTIAGTTRALLDYANANQKYLGNKSFLAFNKKVDSSFEPHWSQSNFKQTVDDSFNAVEKTFPTKLGENLENLESYIKENNIEYVYQIKSGEPDGYLFKNAKNLIHAVFPQHPNNKHGEKYAFVSQWLSEHCSNGEIPYVPHMVKTPKYDLEELKIEFRKKHNIPLDAKVFGRLGSYNEFNIEFVHEAIKQVLNKDKNIYFIFCNTKGFYEHPNISYFYPVFDNKEKYSFISACDAMIHARKRGETFGISIAEYSSCNKPIFTWSDSDEKAHLQMLGNKAIIYKDQKNLEDLMLNYKISKNFDYNSYREFSPETVINKFENIFLK
jgi:glycosyltransferase involved in cell wall biosynthesis